MTGNEQVLVEMHTFLQALTSYADRVRVDPEVTFEEHHVSLMTIDHPGPPQAAHRSSRNH